MFNTKKDLNTIKTPFKGSNSSNNKNVALSDLIEFLKIQLDTVFKIEDRRWKFFSLMGTLASGLTVLAIEFSQIRFVLLLLVLFVCFGTVVYLINLQRNIITFETYVFTIQKRIMNNIGHGELMQVGGGFRSPKKRINYLFSTHGAITAILIGFITTIVLYILYLWQTLPDFYYLPIGIFLFLLLEEFIYRITLRIIQLPKEVF